MRYSMMVRSRPCVTVSIAEKHHALFSCLGPAGWGFQSYPPAPNIKHHLAAIVQLRQYLQKGMKGRIQYALRSPAPDAAMYDDFILLEFDPNAVAYQALVTNGFVEYIKCFSAYTAEIMDVRCYELDFDKARATDGRHGVVRFSPVCFFDRELCLRSFRLTPDELAGRIATVAEAVHLVHDGILIKATSRIISIEECNDIDMRMRAKIGV